MLPYIFTLTTVALILAQLPAVQLSAVRKCSVTLAGSLGNAIGTYAGFIIAELLKS